jgi:hypothetical protein
VSGRPSTSSSASHGSDGPLGSVHSPASWICAYRRVAQPREQRDLALEAPARVGRHETVLHQLDGHLASGRRLRRFVDAAHPALADAAVQQEAVDALPFEPAGRAHGLLEEAPGPVVGS